MSASSPVVEDRLSERLKTVQNNYVLGLASLALLTSESAQIQLRADSAQFGGFTVQFLQVAELMLVPTHRDDAINSFLLMLMCSLIKDTFELTRHHAKRGGVLAALKTQHWYQFARLVRNCLGHNFILEFNERDLRMMPVQWRGRTLTASMNGSPLPLHLFGYEQAWQLFLDMRQYSLDKGL